IIDGQATDLLGLLNDNNYPKGAWVLHSLRGLMGDSAFFRGPRAYYHGHEHKTALSSDLAAVMSREAGQNLGWYFSQALTQPGYPVIATKTEVDGGHLVIQLDQVQKASWGTYRMPNLEVRIGGRTIAMPMTNRTARAVTHWDQAEPPKVEVD